MKADLQELLAEYISDATIFELFKFIHGLSKALESICFDRMLQNSSSCAIENLGPVKFSQPNGHDEDDSFWVRE